MNCLNISAVRNGTIFWNTHILYKFLLAKRYWNSFWRMNEINNRFKNVLIFLFVYRRQKMKLKFNVKTDFLFMDLIWALNGLLLIFVNKSRISRLSDYLCTKHNAWKRTRRIEKWRVNVLKNIIYKIHMNSVWLLSLYLCLTPKILI